jgi:hypothetical protein
MIGCIWTIRLCFWAKYAFCVKKGKRVDVDWVFQRESKYAIFVLVRALIP